MDDLFAIGEGGELAVRLADRGHDRATAREDGTQHDLGVRQALFEFGEDGFDAKDRVLGCFATADIVGADHEHRDLGLDALDFTVLETPKDILGAVAALAEIHRFARTEVALICRGASAVVGDRVAYQDHIDVTLLGGGDTGFMVAHPFFFLLGAGDWGDAGWLLGKRGRRESGEREECGAGGFLHVGC